MHRRGVTLAIAIVGALIGPGCLAATAQASFTVPAGDVATISSVHFGGAMNCPVDHLGYGYTLDGGSRVQLAEHPEAATCDNTAAGASAGYVVPGATIGPFATSKTLQIYLEDFFTDPSDVFTDTSLHALVTGSNPFLVRINDSFFGECDNSCPYGDQGPFLPFSSSVSPDYNANLNATVRIGPAPTAPITCAVTATSVGPPARQDVTVMAPAGIASIAPHITNGTVSTAYDSDRTQAIVTATKTDQTKKTVWSFDVVDAAGNTMHCS